MNQQRTVESRVLSILKDCPRARFDDMILIMHYYNRYANFLRAGEQPLCDLAFNYKVYGLPCLKPSAGQGSVCSRFFRNTPATPSRMIWLSSSAFSEVTAMENKKRKVGDYTVLCAVNIGSREIILAENEQSANGERFLCCYGEHNDIFEKFTECAVGDDYIDAALFFAERIKQDAERFREEVEKLDIPVTVITEADCIPDHYKNDINGKIIAINPAILKPEYQRADRQLYYVTGGFGASANARGSAVFCKNLYDGKNTRYERMDVLGEVKPERMPDWAKEKAAAFSRTIQGKDHER